jgi:hypothetical protein
MGNEIEMLINDNTNKEISSRTEECRVCYGILQLRIRGRFLNLLTDPFLPRRTGIRQNSREQSKALAGIMR